MRRITLFVMTLTTLCLGSVYAQNTGFGGKRVLLKTDLLNGVRSPLVNASAELLLTRRLSLSVGARMNRGKYNQIYYYSEYEGGMPSSVKNRLAEKAEIRSRMIMLEGRLYSGGVLPAPRGAFLYAAYNYGKVDVQGSFHEALAAGSGSSFPNGNSYYLYEAKDVLVWGLEFGCGYQSFINKFLTLGFKIGFNKTFFNADGKYEPKELSGVAKTYGPNLLRLSPLLDGERLTPLGLVSIDDDDNNYYSGSFGLAFYFQIGILVF